METRIQIDQTEPKAIAAMYALENYIAQSQLNEKDLNLIKIRASQINGCGFCIDMHTKAAIELGETEHRIFLLNAWQNTNAFTPKEKVILEMTEAITLIHHGGLPEAIYQKAVLNFEANYISKIIMAIVTINAWNRIAISTHKPFED